jgi:RNase H-fold protein (predicted Holliday junction resolvase)
MDLSSLLSLEENHQSDIDLMLAIAEAESECSNTDVSELDWNELELYGETYQVEDTFYVQYPYKSLYNIIPDTEKITSIINKINNSIHMRIVVVNPECKDIFKKMISLVIGEEKSKQLLFLIQR